MPTNKTPGGMILKKDQSSHFTEHSIMIPCNHNDEPDILTISNIFGLTLDLRNSYTNEKKKVYYHLEIDIESEFYGHLKTVMKEIFNLEDKESE